jgi:hypothetical protein
LPGEPLLFRGTKANPAGAIFKDGFNRGLSGQNGPVKAKKIQPLLAPFLLSNLNRYNEDRER